MNPLRASLLASAALAILLPSTSAALAEETAKSIYKKTLHATAVVETREASGTAWVVDKSRKLLITNHHVVEDFDDVLLFFPIWKDGKPVAERTAYKGERGQRGKVIDTDVARDLALIELIDPLPEGTIELKLAAESADPADRIHSIGNPGASGALWVYTSGTVRQVYEKHWFNLDAAHKAVLSRKSRVMETQSPVNHGDSGGPVVNDEGDVVAVVSSGKERQGDSVVNLMSWCIDVREVRSFVDQCRRELDPKTAADHVLRGDRLYERNRWSAAVEAYTAALKLEKSNERAYRGRGLALSRKGDYDTALADCDEAIRLDRDDAIAWECRGWVHDKKNQLDQAVTDYTRAIQLDPKFSRAYNNRGFVYHNRNDLDRALADYSRAVEADADFATAYLNRGDILLGRKQYEGAFKNANAALNINPYLSYGWVVRGLALQGAGEYERAAQNFAEGSTFDPKNAAFYVHRGNALTFKDHWDDAIQLYSRAIELNPELAMAYYYRASAYETLGSDMKAQPDYEKALRLNPGYADKVKLQTRRFLKIVNERSEAIRVCVQYETVTSKGDWDWFPEAPGNGKYVYFDIPAGKSTYLVDSDVRVRGRRVRIWSTGLSTGDAFNGYKDKDLWICPQDGYKARQETTFTFTFNR